MNNSAKIQTRAYQLRHKAIRDAFTAGYTNQYTKTHPRSQERDIKPKMPTNKGLQDNKWYSIVGAAKIALGCDIYPSKMHEFAHVLGSIHADELTITSRNIVQLEAIALYDYYNNLYVDPATGKPMYHVVDEQDESQDHSIVYKPVMYTASEFKEILVNEHISIGSEIRIGTLFSWFYRYNLKMEDTDSYPAYLFARVVYLAVCNNKVKLLPNGVIKTPFYERIQDKDDIAISA